MTNPKSLDTGSSEEPTERLFTEPMRRQIQSLIESEVQQARIDELEKLFDGDLSESDSINVATYWIRERLATLKDGAKE